MSGTATTTAGSPFSLTVKATNGVSPDATQAFTLTVNAAPSITTPPSDKTVVLNGATTFSVVAGGTPTLTYKWQVSTDGGSNWSDISADSTYSNPTTATLGINATSKPLNGTKYRVVVSNGITPPATSSAATLTVNYAPTFTTTPSSQTVNLKDDVTFTAAVDANPSTTPPLTYQWKLGSNDLAGATNATLTINKATGVNAGTYTVTASNGIGTAATASATLGFHPGFGDFTPTTGSQGTLVTINGAGFTGATGVNFNGVAGQFTVVSDYQITATVPTFATTGPIAVTTASSGTLTSTDNLTIVAGPRLANLRSIGPASGGEGALLADFTLEGTGTKAVLVRAIGPTLGGSGTLADPVLSIYDSSGTLIGSNDNWDASLSSTFTAVGAVTLTNGSKDSALLLNLAPGTYTARVTGVGDTTGFAMVEVFEADTVTTSRIAHLGRRAPHGTSSNNTNFKLTGAGSTTLLVRAVCSGLGLPDTLTSPQIVVNTGAAIIPLNTNSAEIAAATMAVGAMPLGANGVAALVTLPAGDHNVLVASTDGGTGLVLTEIFVVDSFRPEAFPPALLAPLPNKAANLNDTVVFAAPFVGKPAPTFKWQRNQTDLPGQTAATLTLSNVTSADTAKYRVILDNTGGTPGSGLGVVTSAEAQLDVNKSAQTITFAAIADKTYAPGGTFDISASTTSSLPVTFTSSDTSVATIGAPSMTGGVTTATVSIHKAGNVNITASQAGTLDYQAATDVVRGVVINKAAATIALSGLTATYDGNAKPVTATTTPTGLTVDITYTPSGGSATSSAPTNAGSYAVSATVNDTNYAGTKSDTLVIAKASQVVTLGALDPKTFGDADFSASATASSTLAVTYASDNTAVATINATTGLVHIVGAGSAKITAAQAGNGNFNGAEASQTLTVAKANQTITFGTLANKTYGDAAFSVSATTTAAGLSPSLSIASGPATISGSQITITGAGNVTVRASQLGNANYNAAVDVDQTFTVAKADQTITFASLPSKPLDSGTFTLPLNASSGLPITYTTSSPSSGTVATISGNTVTLVNTGTITITANQAGDANYNAATAVSQVLTVLNASQTITFDAFTSPQTYATGATFTLTATSKKKDATASGLAVAFASSDSKVAMIGTPTLNPTSGVTSAVVTIVGAGTADITASQPGSDDYAAAEDVKRTLVVNKAAATITLGALAQTYDGTARVVTTDTSPTGLAVVVTYTPAGGSATTTAPVNVGSYAVNATIDEANYTGTKSGTLVVAKANQTITFALGSPILLNAGTVPLTGTTTATGLDVSYTSSNPSVAAIGDGALIIKALGSATITAKQAGNANYNAAADVAQAIVVNPVAPVMTLPSAAATAVIGSAFVYGPIGINALSAPVTFSMTGAPIGLSVDPATGNISGAPTSANTLPSYTISLKAQNVTGSDTKTIALTLNPPAPVFTSAAAASATAGSLFTYTMAASNATSFTADNLPAWLTRTDNVLSGTPPTAGTFTVDLTATNPTGSIALPLTITVTLPTGAPVYTGPKNPSGRAGEAFSFTPNFGGAGAATSAFSLTGSLPAGVTQAVNFATTGALSGTPTAVGEFPITLVCTRTLAGAGGWTLAASVDLKITINPAANAPVVSFTASGTGTTGSGAARVAVVGTSISLQLSGSGAPTGFTATGLPPGVTMNGSGLISGNPTTPGTYNAQITATGSGGTGAPALLQFVVNPHPQAPVITSSPIVSGQVGVGLTPATYALTASPAITTTYQMTGTLPAGLLFDGTAGTVAGIPEAGTAGQYKVFFAGTNTNGLGTALEVTFKIAAPLNVPEITSNGTATAQVGQPFSYAVVATNNPTGYAATPTTANGLTFAVDGGVATISGVPSVATTGTPVSFSLTATNGDGTGSAKTLAITVKPAPATPVVSSADTATGRVGLALEYQIVASDSPSSYVATDLPEGLKVDVASGLISGTPKAAGTFVAKIRAANGNGLGAEQSLTFTIGAAPDAPAIKSDPAVTGQVGVAFSYQIATNGTATSYAVAGDLPSGLSLDTTSGLIRGSPTAPGTSVVSLTATGDGGTSLPQRLTITIKAAEGVPAITSSRSVPATAGQPFTYTITATNMPGSTPFPPGTSLDAVDLPEGLAVNPATGVIQGVPASAGVTIASVYGVNAAGTGPAQDLRIEVAAPATAPVVNPPDTVSAQAGTPFSFQITATNTNVPPVSYEVLDTPVWMTLDPKTGLLAGTPTAPGKIKVQRIAKNSAGASTARELTIAIAAAPDTPVVTGLRDISGTVGQALVAFQVAATPTASSFIATSLPPGLKMSAGGAITGTPTASGTFKIMLSGVNAKGIGTPVEITFTIAQSFSLTPGGN